jgi:hypothetical protein
MSRFFTLSDAERLLPEVEQAMREALRLYSVHQTADSKYQETLRRISMLGGALVNRDEIADLRSARDSTLVDVQSAVERIHEYGCQVKDLRTGLVDFPTMYRGTEVLLCWRFGEDRIRYWHGLEEGFRGRKPIDQDFLDNHRGDHVN